MRSALSEASPTPPSLLMAASSPSPCSPPSSPPTPTPRDAVGLGAGMAHPRESEEWKSMTMRQRYEFFAPIWRVMRDDNVSVDDVAEQVGGAPGWGGELAGQGVPGCDGPTGLGPAIVLPA